MRVLCLVACLLFPAASSAAEVDLEACKAAIGGHIKSLEALRRLNANIPAAAMAAAAIGLSDEAAAPILKLLEVSPADIDSIKDGMMTSHDAIMPMCLEAAREAQQ